jgi:outer membrane protein OmpA-like peptidoglycan-associated protein
LCAAAAQAQPLFQRLPARVNSALDEQNPIVSPDGRSVFFTVSNHERSAGGRADKGDIWITTWADSVWTAPEPVTALNNAHYNAVAGFAGDPNAIFLWGHYDKNSVLSQGIAKSTYRNGQWQFPSNITIPYYLNRSVYHSGTLNVFGNVLLIGADGFGTLGAEDLYVSFRRPDGAWTEPKNLGRAINTPLQDVSPFLSDDGRRMYFSSNGRPGSGSFDVFYADRLDDTWTNWSEPVNLGPEVNTPGRELFYHPYPRFGMALYTSTQNSDGYGDIKVHRLPPDKPAQEAPAVILEVVDAPAGPDFPAPPGKNQVEVYGLLLSAKDQMPIDGRITFESDSVFQQQTTAGAYRQLLTSSKEYAIKIEANGYVGKTERLDLRTFQLKKAELNFALQPAEVGVTVNLKNVLFQQSTANLLPESYAELDVVANMLAANPGMEIFLAGHTDNRGQHHLNVRLSQSRVEAVKDYLVKKGIDPRRISGQGFGGVRPIADNDAEDTRKLNRRVEFTITKIN